MATDIHQRSGPPFRTAASTATQADGLAGADASASTSADQIVHAGGSSGQARAAGVRCSGLERSGLAPTPAAPANGSSADPNIFVSIRAQAAAVASQARQVHIDTGAIDAYCRALPDTLASAPAWDATTHFTGEAEALASYVLCLDAVNFGSGYSTYFKKRPNHSGYFTVASALRDRFMDSGTWSCAELQAITAQDCAQIFGQDVTEPNVSELMGLFAQAWRELGSHLAVHYGASARNFVQAAQKSAATLVSQLLEMPMFSDVQTYAGLQVPLLKRAQICVSDLSLAFGGAGLGFFHDLNQLTIFADNVVPHVLRIDGLLRYSATLAHKIDTHHALLAGSPEEVELRACSVAATERVVARLAELGRPATAQELDFYLWHRGHEAAYKQTPRHRTKTYFY